MAASLASWAQQILYSLVQSPLLLANYLQGNIRFPINQPSVVSKTAAECRYRLDTDSSTTITLPDGRKLGYAEYGVRTGHPIFNLHGLPGARLGGAYQEPAALKVGVRIISVDRPGYGLSSPHPSRTILDHAKDVEYLAEHLKLDSYGVIGTSGGGPYALACAASMPSDKLKVVAVTCGLGPPDMGLRGMRWQNWAGFAFGWRYFPGLCRWWFGSEPAAQLHLTDEERLELIMRQFEKNKSKTDPKDIEFFGDIDTMRVFVANARQMYRQGLDGLLQDGRLLSSDFGFRIQDIRSDLPVHLWYGKKDTLVPPNHGEQTAARLGSNAHLRLEDDTHASIFGRWHEERLSAMVRVMNNTA